MGVIWHKKGENHYKVDSREDLLYSHFPGGKLLLSHLSGGSYGEKALYNTSAPNNAGKS